MKVLDLAKLAELVLYALLVRLLVYVRDDDNPPFNGSYCRGLGLCLHSAVVTLVGGGLLLAFSGGSVVNVHFCVGHVEFCLCTRL